MPLCFLDETSRFPYAMPLRSLTAKSCCEAMLPLFQFTGMPSKITTDRASSFTGELTREFLRRLGCSPIWCTPRHPEANSVERTVGTIKSLIAKVACQHPKSWHQYINFVLWAMRESVNESRVYSRHVWGGSFPSKNSKFPPTQKKICRA